MAHCIVDIETETRTREAWEAAWLEEIQRREEENESGKVKLVSLEEVMALLDAALKNRVSTWPVEQG